MNLHTWTGAWGTVIYWNAFVANLELHGQGTFVDPRLDDPVQFPVAARNGLGHVRREPDLITAKLPALHFYQLALPAPTPPPWSFDPQAAARGDDIAEGIAIVQRRSSGAPDSLAAEDAPAHRREAVAATAVPLSTSDSVSFGRSHLS